MHGWFIKSKIIHIKKNTKFKENLPIKYLTEQ